MNMGVSTWMALDSAIQGDQPRRAINGATLRRIGDFARSRGRRLGVELLFVNAEHALRRRVFARDRLVGVSR